MKRLSILSILFTLLTANAFAQDRQFLYIEFSPADATLEINGEVQNTEDGIFQKLLPLGEYEYKIYRDGYRTDVGTINMQDSYKAKRVEVNLIKKFGYLRVRYYSYERNGYTHTESSIGRCYESIDGKEVHSLWNLELPIGIHKLYIRSDYYGSYEGTFEIHDNTVTEIIPELVKTIIGVNFKCEDPEAHIVIIDEEGNAPPAGCVYYQLNVGQTYKLESQRIGHKSYFMDFTPTGADDGKEIVIPAPTPIYGNLEITSNPTNAKVYLGDGFDECIGQTPLSTKLLVGTYIIHADVGMCKFKPVEVTVTEGDQSMSFDMPHGALAVSCKIPNSTVYIDGQNVGDAPLELPISLGEHIVKVTYYDNILGKKFEEEQMIEICEGEKKELFFNMSPIGSLSITSIPGNAEIYDERCRCIGNTPLYIPYVAAEEYEFTIKFKSLVHIMSVRRNILVTEGECAELSLKSRDIDISDIDVIFDWGTIELEEPISFQQVEQEPSFNGGDANQFSKWVNQNLIYPEIAKENGIQERITLQFVVNKNGTVSDVKVLRGVDPLLCKEAVRVVSSSPKWTPGKQRDRAVRVVYTFPVIFKL